MTSGPWLPFGSADDGLRLFCFPHAGAGAAAYRQWAEGLPAGVVGCPVQLPGRETRCRETPYRALEPLVADVADALMPLLSDRPFALFGHSLGAIVAFELSRTLRRESAPAPVHLFVSGRIAPQLADARPRLHSMPDDDLVRELSGLGGTPAALLDSAGVRSAVLPVLRADLALNEMYRHVAEEPLDVPLTVFGGHSDPKTSVTELASWQAQTTRRPFGLHMMAGGHFFVAEHRTSLFGIMANVLEPWLAPVCASSQLGLQGDVSR